MNLFQYLGDLIKNKDFILKKNDYNISQNHLTALSGSYTFYKTPKESDKYGTTIWNYIAWSGNYEALKQALLEYPEIKKLRNNNGKTIWHFLAWSGNYESLKQALLDHSEIKNLFDNNENSIWDDFYRNSLTEDLIKAYEELNMPKKYLSERGVKIPRKETEISKILKKFDKEQLDRITSNPKYSSYICPISKEIIKDPVLTEVGITYDRKFIEEWLLTND